MGTTVSVDQLFYNIPVRRQELKKIAIKEIPKIVHYLQNLCIAYPHLGLSLVNVSSEKET